MKKIILYIFFCLSLSSINAQSSWMYGGISGSAGFARGSVSVRDNSNLFLISRRAQTSTILGLSANYIHKDKWLCGLSYNFGNYKIMFSDRDVHFQTGGQQELFLIENVKYRSLGLHYRYYFQKKDNLFYYLGGEFHWQRTIYPDSNYLRETIFNKTIINSYPNYHQGNFYIQPEFGISYQMENHGIAEFGLKFVVGAQPLIQGKYTYSYQGTNEVFNTNYYKASGSYLALQIRYMLPLYEVRKRKKVQLPGKKAVVFDGNNVPRNVDNRKVVKQGNIKVPTNKVTFYIWDSGTIDGDSVSLNINGEWILENFPVTAEKKEITIDLIPETNNYLILYAVNLGKQPPNTVAVSYFDGTREVRLSLKSTLTECGAINFTVED